MNKLISSCIPTLISYANLDDKIWVLDGDLADSYGLVEFAQARQDRFIMCGIAEQNMVSMAAGMASCGLRPWVFSFAAFLAYRALDQIRVSVSQSNLPVALVGSHAGGCAGKNGKTHQAISDISVVSSLGNIEVWTPCDAKDGRFVISQVLKQNKPSYIRASREKVYDLPGEAGCIRWLTSLSNNVLLCSGISAYWAMEVAERLANKNIDIAVVHIAKVFPITEDVEKLIDKLENWFVIEDHIYQGGLASHIVEKTRKLPDLWFGWLSTWPGGSGESEELRYECGLDSLSITNKIESKLIEKHRNVNTPS